MNTTRTADQTQPLPLDWHWIHDLKVSTLAETRFRAAPTVESFAVTTIIPVVG